MYLLLFHVHAVILFIITFFFNVESDLPPPELYGHQIRSGETLYAMVFRPHRFQLNKKYPTVLSIYGGPEVQLVSNTFKVSVEMRVL